MPSGPRAVPQDPAPQLPCRATSAESFSFQHHSQLKLTNCFSLLRVAQVLMLTS